MNTDLNKKPRTVVMPNYSTRKVIFFNKPGRPGDPGQPGKSPTDDHLLSIIRPLIPAPIPGKSPTAEYLLTLIRPLIPVVKNGESPSDLHLLSLIRPLIPTVKDGDPGKPGKDGSPDNPEEIVAKINISKKKIKLRMIEGIEALFPEGGRYTKYSTSTQKLTDIPSEIVFGLGLTATIDSTGKITITAASSGGIGAWNTPSQTPLPDGSVTVFTVGSSAPTDVLVDGVIYPSGTVWTFLAGQITISIGDGAGPTQFIRYR